MERRLVLLTGILLFVVLCWTVGNVSRGTYANIQPTYGVSSPLMPAPGDRIHLLGHSATSVIGIDETRGVTRQKDGTYTVLSVLIWNPDLRQKLGDAIDAFIVDIDCQHDTYDILTDASLDAHWHLIKIHPVKPQIVQNDSQAVAAALVNYVCHPEPDIRDLTSNQQAT